MESSDTPQGAERDDQGNLVATMAEPPAWLSQITTLQEEQGNWQRANFPDSKAYQMRWGMHEELGELIHAMLKRSQNIRGSAEQHTIKAVDAVGDFIIYTVAFCNLSNIHLGNLLVWGKFNPQQAALDENKGTAAVEALMGLFVTEQSCYETMLEVHGEGADETKELHAGMAGVLSRLVQEMSALSVLLCGRDALSVALDTWTTEVQKRNWKKNAESGLADSEDREDELEVLATHSTKVTIRTKDHHEAFRRASSMLPGYRIQSVGEKDVEGYCESEGAPILTGDKYFPLEDGLMLSYEAGKGDGCGEPRFAGLADNQWVDDDGNIHTACGSHD